MLFEAACRYGFNPKIHPIISNDSGDLLMRDFFSNYKLSQKEKYYNAEIFPDDHILDTFKLPLFGKESIKNNLLILQELYNMDPERYSP